VLNHPGALVVGAGPAGLAAAEVLSEAGHSVLVAEAMPSPARKFLMAGKSGLNLTKDEASDLFHGAFGPDLPPALRTALSDFGPSETMAWAQGLGQELFTGSTGRVFPIAWKGSPLLRAWLARLGERGVELRTRWRWTGWEGEAFALRHARRVPPPSGQGHDLGPGRRELAPPGSDGAWAAAFPEATVPFRPVQHGPSGPLVASHGRPFRPAGQGAAWAAGGLVSRGEVVVSAKGLEGGGLYPCRAPCARARH
jgi:succinate dehydrogenase/fumarate reductase flavoprotein subunit